MKEINGIEDYYITKDGRCFSTKISPRYNPNGELREVQPRKHPSGYLYLGLFVGSKKSRRRIWKRLHRVVYESHVGEIPKGYEIDHISGDKWDNRLDNLRLVTRSQNMKLAWERKRSKTN